MVFGGLVSGLTSFAKTAAPFAAGLGLASSGGQAATFSRLASGLGAIGGTEQGQRTAIDRAPEPASETSMSGEAGTSIINVIPQARTSGGIVPASYVPGRPSSTMPGIQRAGGPLAVIPPAVAAGRGIMGMLGLAGGAITVAPFIIDPFTGEQKKLRVTRKLKSDVKKAVEMFGVEFVAEQMGTDIEVVFYILTKKMRNDGPYVTKAAVRKTRQTVRKMKNLCDMYDDLRPAAKRRAPVRRNMATKITNVK